MSRTVKIVLAVVVLVLLAMAAFVLISSLTAPSDINVNNIPAYSKTAAYSHTLEPTVTPFPAP